MSRAFGFVVVALASSCVGPVAETGTGGAGSTVTGFSSATSVVPSCLDATSGSSTSSASAWTASAGGASGCDGALTGVHFTTDVGPIFAGCSGELCHVAPTYGTTVGQPSMGCCGARDIVKPFAPNESYLLDKVLGERLCTGERMPLGSSALSPADIATLRGWICEGAPND